MTTMRIETPFPNVPIPADWCLVDDWMDAETHVIAALPFAGQRGFRAIPV
jgi:hypothetical protein